MAYHCDQGEQHRNICLIPASAHGTNAASAQMAGLQVVTLPTNKDGSVSVSVFKEEVGYYCMSFCSYYNTPSYNAHCTQVYMYKYFPAYFAECVHHATCLLWYFILMHTYIIYMYFSTLVRSLSGLL